MQRHHQLERDIIRLTGRKRRKGDIRPRRAPSAILEINNLLPACRDPTPHNEARTETPDCYERHEREEEHSVECWRACCAEKSEGEGVRDAEGREREVDETPEERLYEEGEWWKLVHRCSPWRRARGLCATSRHRPGCRWE